MNKEEKSQLFETERKLRFRTHLLVACATCLAVVVLLSLTTSEAFANGSEIGHHNGHHDHTDESKGAVVDNSNHVENSNSVGIDNRVSVVVGNNASSGAEGRSGGDGGTSSASTGAISIVEDNRYPASSAAAIYASECQSGLSGQTRSGGFGTSGTDQFCYLIKMALVNWTAYERELANIRPENCDTVKAEVTCPAEGYVDCQVLSCPSPNADKYLARYHSNLDDAQSIIDAGQEVSIADRVSGLLIKPMSMLAAVLLL